MSPKTGADGVVTAIRELKQSSIRINAGLFVLKRDIFEYIQPGEELVIEPFRRLIQKKQLAAYEYDGFFAAMDTFKDKRQLDDLYEDGDPPWVVWSDRNGGSEKPVFGPKNAMAASCGGCRWATGTVRFGGLFRVPDDSHLRRRYAVTANCAANSTHWGETVILSQTRFSEVSS